MMAVTPGDYSYFKGTVPERKIHVGIRQQKRWRYYDYGPKTVQPLICIAGAAGTADVFYKQVLSLSSKGFRVIAVDAPPLWSHEEWITSFEKFLDTLHIFEVHLYGSSLGGFLAQLFCQYRPRRVKSLILSNTFLDTRYFHEAFTWSSLFHWAPEFVLKRLILSGLREGPHEPYIADSIDFVVGQLETLRQQELASRLMLNTTLAAVGPLHLEDDKITLMDTNDYSAVPRELRDALYSRYPNARKALLKSGGDFPFLSRADEVTLHLQLHLRHVAVNPDPPTPPPEAAPGPRWAPPKETPLEPPTSTDTEPPSPSSDSSPLPLPPSSPESHVPQRFLSLADWVPRSQGAVGGGQSSGDNTRPEVSGTEDVTVSAPMDPLQIPTPSEGSDSDTGPSPTVSPLQIPISANGVKQSSSQPNLSHKDATPENSGGIDDPLSVHAPRSASLPASPRPGPNDPLQSLTERKPLPKSGLSVSQPPPLSPQPRPLEDVDPLLGASQSTAEVPHEQDSEPESEELPSSERPTAADPLSETGTSDLGMVEKAPGASKQAGDDSGTQSEASGSRPLAPASPPLEQSGAAVRESLGEETHVGAKAGEI